MLFVINKNIEKELHRRYSDKRVRGEWFRLEYKDVEYLRKKYSDKYLQLV